MRIKRILLSAVIVIAVSTATIGATTAYFSDIETSSGNTMTAGSVNLGIGTTSWYNGASDSGTSWAQVFDFSDGQGPGDAGAYVYLNFANVKPGDWGSEVIDFRVDDSDAWVCLDVALTASDENTLTDPEQAVGDTAAEGELANEIIFMWWADDGDGVWEDNEMVLPGGPLGGFGVLGAMGVGGSVTMAITDSVASIFNPQDLSNDSAIVGNKTYYIGNAWCFGQFGFAPIPAGQGQDPSVDPGFTCDGSFVTNASQSDSMSTTVTLSAIQARNNLTYECGTP